MWGCGSNDALESQRIQKKWEAGAVKREQGRKVRKYMHNNVMPLVYVKYTFSRSLQNLS